MIILFEIDPPFRWRPKIERIGNMSRFIFGCFSVALFRGHGINVMWQFFYDHNRRKIEIAKEHAKEYGRRVQQDNNDG